MPIFSLVPEASTNKNFRVVAQEEVSRNEDEWTFNVYVACPEMSDQEASNMIFLVDNEDYDIYFQDSLNWVTFTNYVPKEIMDGDLTAIALALEIGPEEYEDLYSGNQRWMQWGSTNWSPEDPDGDISERDADK